MCARSPVSLGDRQLNWCEHPLAEPGRQMGWPTTYASRWTLTLNRFPLGDVVFLHGAPDAFLTVPPGDGEGQPLSPLRFKM